MDKIEYYAKEASHYAHLGGSTMAKAGSARANKASQERISRLSSLAQVYTDKGLDFVLKKSKLDLKD